MTRANHRTRRTAMTLIELLLSIAVTAGVFGVLVLVSNTLRADTAQQRTRRTLDLLHKALVRYHDVYGRYPDGSTAEVLETLYKDPATRWLGDDLPPQRHDDGQLVVPDGYGRPVRFLSQGAGGSHPADFVSVGPDGKIGDPDAASADMRQAAIDNLYGSDLEVPH